MRRIAANTILLILDPLMIAILMVSRQLSNIERGSIVILISLFSLFGLSLFKTDCAERLDEKSLKIISTCIDIFENMCYILFFSGLLFCLNIRIFPYLGR